MCNLYIAPFHTKYSERFKQFIPPAGLFNPAPSQLPGKHRKCTQALRANALQHSDNFFQLPIAGYPF